MLIGPDLVVLASEAKQSRAGWGLRSRLPRHCAARNDRKAGQSGERRLLGRRLLSLRAKRRPYVLTGEGGAPSMRCEAGRAKSRRIGHVIRSARLDPVSGPSGFRFGVALRRSAFRRECADMGHSAQGGSCRQETNCLRVISCPKMMYQRRLRRLMICRIFGAQRSAQLTA